MDNRVPGPRDHLLTEVLERELESLEPELGTQPFYFLGAVKYVEHRGEKPVSFTWHLPTDAGGAV
jgi:hypothetical protein